MDVLSGCNVNINLKQDVSTNHLAFYKEGKYFLMERRDANYPHFYFKLVFYASLKLNVVLA